MGERLPCTQEASGSIPLISTTHLDGARERRGASGIIDN